VSIRLQIGRLILMACGAGLAVLSFLVGQWRDLAARTAAQGHDSLALKDLERAELALRQCLATVELVAGGGDTSLAAGAAEQSRETLLLLASVSQSELGRAYPRGLASATDGVRMLWSLLAEATPAGGARRAEEVRQMLARFASRSRQLVDEVHAAAQELNAGAEQRAFELESADERLGLVVAGCLVLFVLFLTLLWSWTARTLVVPLRALSAAADRSRVHKTPFALVEGGPTEVRQLTRDISAFVHALSHAKEITEAEVVRRTDELVRASCVKDEFLATMSHELRTPLNGVLGMLDTMPQQGLDPEQSNALRMATQAAEELQRLLGDILDLTTLQAGSARLPAVMVDPGALLREQEPRWAEQARGRGLSLEVQAAGLPPRLALDPARWIRVFDHLVGNAIKFTESGSVVVAVGLETTPDNRRWLRCSVSDTGIGIAEPDQSRLFQRFTQLDGSHRRRHGGIGLGLALCQRLVEHMGGQIGCESQASRGSRFWFRVPAAVTVESVEAVPAPPLSTPRAIGARRILVVEDNRVNLEVLRRLLLKEQHQVATAENGVEAVARVQREVFDLILMDLQMPLMDGLEATREIRRLEQERGCAPGWPAHVPIIAVTANALPGDPALCVDAGMDDYLAKPIRREPLLLALERAATRLVAATGPAG
jgi:signal transduction histidine kinase/ActR/RegA family two-component response regulator